MGGRKGGREGGGERVMGSALCATYMHFQESFASLDGIAPGCLITSSGMLTWERTYA